MRKLLLAAALISFALPAQATTQSKWGAYTVNPVSLVNSTARIGADTSASSGPGSIQITPSTTGSLFFNSGGDIGGESLSTAFDRSFGSTGGTLVFRSTGSWQALTLGTNLSISGSTLNATSGGGTTSPGGSSGALQYNNGGSFGGAALTGLVKGNGSSAPTAAVAGTDYAPATTGTAILYASNGGFANVIPGANCSFNSGVFNCTGSGSSNVSSGAFASKPGSPSQGQLYFATNLGTNGTTIIYSGAVWKPVSGAAVLYQNGVQSTLHTGDTTQTNVGTITIPAGLLSANGSLRVTWHGVMTGTASTKSYRMYYSSVSGGTNGTTIFSAAAAAGNLSLMAVKVITNRNATNSQITSATGSYGSSAQSTSDVATTIDTTATSYINLTVQLGSAADAAGTDALTVEWLEP